MTGLNRKLFRDLGQMIPQIVTISLLIVGGVSVLVSSWSSYESLRRSKDSFYREFRFPDIFADVVRAPASVAVKAGRIPGVAVAEPRIVKDALVDVPAQAEPALGRLISLEGEHQRLNLVYLRSGRMPRAGHGTEVVVHEAFAAAHRLRPGDALRIQLSGQQRRVVIAGVGISPEYVYALSPVAPLPDNKRFGVFWMLRPELERLTGMQGAFNSLLLLGDRKEDLAEPIRALGHLLRPYGNIFVHDRTRQMSNVFVEDEIRQQRIMSIVTPAIFLSVAVFILNVVLSRMITLQRPQVATLKSLGYGSWALTFHYFLLVTVILVAGLIPSLISGAWIGRWYAVMYRDFFRFPSIDFTLSGWAILLGILAGLVPGWMGAVGSLRSVFSLQPAEALRPQAPPPFRRSILERYLLPKGIKAVSLLVLRTLFLRPVRLTMSVLGVAASVAILINGSFWTDVIDFMMDRQFREMRREDLSVVLAHPRDANVFAEFRGIPGVLMAEGERSVAVRLTHRNRHKELTLIASNPQAQMSRVLDKNGAMVQPKPGGVLLSRYFETEFGLKPGDTVELSVLEGALLNLSVSVVGFVDDLVGQQAYAAKADMHRWLRETPAFNVVHLKVDPDKAQDIYVELKRRPEVAGVTVRRLMLSSFLTSFGGMIATFTFVLYVFAAGIAASVMFNLARIGFSERSREIASLRILGFGVRDVFDLLFLDIGLQVLAALVPGLALGYGLCRLSTDFIHNDMFKFPLVIEASTYGAAVLVVLVTFLLSGVVIYKKVKELGFSEALKSLD